MSNTLTATEESILASFDYHKPDDAQIERIAGVRSACKACARQLMALLPPSADRTVALRKLHETMMTANKAIVCEPPFERAADCPSHHTQCTAERCVLDPRRPQH